MWGKWKFLFLWSKVCVCVTFGDVSPADIPEKTHLHLGTPFYTPTNTSTQNTHARTRVHGPGPSDHGSILTLCSPSHRWCEQVCTRDPDRTTLSLFLWNWKGHSANQPRGLSDTPDKALEEEPTNGLSRFLLGPSPPGPLLWPQYPSNKFHSELKLIWSGFLTFVTKSLNQTVREPPANNKHVLCFFMSVIDSVN